MNGPASYKLSLLKEGAIHVCAMVDDDVASAIDALLVAQL